MSLLLCIQGVLSELNPWPWSFRHWFPCVFLFPSLPIASLYSKSVSRSSLWFCVFELLLWRSSGSQHHREGTDESRGLVGEIRGNERSGRGKLIFNHFRYSLSPRPDHAISLLNGGKWPWIIPCTHLLCVYLSVRFISARIWILFVQARCFTGI